MGKNVNGFRAERRFHGTCDQIGVNMNIQETTAIFPEKYMGRSGFNFPKKTYQSIA